MGLTILLVKQCFEQHIPEGEQLFFLVSWLESKVVVLVTFCGVPRMDAEGLAVGRLCGLRDAYL